MNQTATYMNIMQESLIRKKSYLQEILELTKEQERLAGEKRFDEEAFNNIIDKKEILINNINEIDKGFTSVYDRVRSEILDNREYYRGPLTSMQGIIRECVDLGMAIEAAEARNRATLEQVFSVGFKGIKQVKQSKKAANKYYKAMSNGNVNDSILYDRKK